MSSPKFNKRKSKAKVLSTKTPFRGKVFSVTSERVLEPNGVTAVRDVVRHSGSVVVLAIDDSEKEPRVLLERQYRYAETGHEFDDSGSQGPGLWRDLFAGTR